LRVGVRVPGPRGKTFTKRTPRSNQAPAPAGKARPARKDGLSGFAAAVQSASVSFVSFFRSSHSGGGALQAEGHLVRGDARGDFRGRRSRCCLMAVERRCQVERLRAPQFSRSNGPSADRTCRMGRRPAVCAGARRRSLVGRKSRSTSFAESRQRWTRAGGPIDRRKRGQVRSDSACPGPYTTPPTSRCWAAGPWPLRESRVL